MFDRFAWFDMFDLLSRRRLSQAPQLALARARDNRAQSARPVRICEQ
jgi:hypothetical protein